MTVPSDLERTARYPVTASMSPPHLEPVPVMGTSALVELMERTALESVQPHLAADETTVGTRIDVHHFRPAFPGDQLEIRTRLVDVGRRLVFAIEAWVGDHRVGCSRHERAVIARDRFGEDR